MKIHEKLKIIIDQSDLPLTTVHKKIKDLFEDKAIAYMTLYRTVNGLTTVREATLYQIATALDIAPSRIKEGTEREHAPSIYRYNEKAFLEIRQETLPFLTGRLTLLAQGRTLTEQNPPEKGSFIKWIYVIQGEITCVVQDDRTEKTIIKKNESFAFKSTLPHYFENNTLRKASAIIVQNPKYL